MDKIKVDVLSGPELGRVKRTRIDPNKEKELQEACAGFESIFIKQMLSAMRDTLPGDALFSQSNGMDIYQSMHDQYLSDQLSNARQSVGIKQFLYQQLKGG
jgi:flagellar protein FlgJ